MLLQTDTIFNMSVVEAIRSAVPVLVHTQSISRESQSALHEMIKQVDSPFLQVERLYMMQCLANELEKLTPQEAGQFFEKMFSSPLPSCVNSFLSHLLAMAISLSFTSILNSSSQLLESELLDFPPTVEEISPDLALASPQMAAVILSKGYFLHKENIFTPEIICQWVQTLNKVDADSFSPFDIRHIIKYSLVGSGSSSLTLHLGILSSIELKRIKPLSWQQISDISKSLSQSNSTLKDRFLQIILVARQAGKLGHKPPKEVENQLLSDYPENPLVKFMLQS